MFNPTALRCAVLAIAVLVSGAAAAQAYPARPIRFVVPQTPGGASDALARVTGQKLGDRSNQQFVIDPRGRRRPDASSEQGSRLRDVNVREPEDAPSNYSRVRGARLRGRIP